MEKAQDGADIKNKPLFIVLSHVPISKLCRSTLGWGWDGYGSLSRFLLEVSGCGGFVLGL